MRSWSISAGRIVGIEVRIHVTFLFLLIFVWMTDPASRAPISAIRGLGLVAVIFVCVILHELGHAVVAVKAGLPPKSIILLPIGGITMLDESSALERGSPAPLMLKRDVRIALAGPLVNLAVALISGSILLAVAPEIHLWMKPWVHSNHLLRSFVWVNLCLALINLLPAYPTDGGRLLRVWFSRSMDPVHATRRAIAIGQTLSTLLMLLGMIANLWFTLIGIFLFFGAQLEERSAIF